VIAMIVLTVCVVLVGVSADDKIKRRKADNHNHNSYTPPVSTTYGSPAVAPADHNNEFCVDVSIYQPVVWVERDEEECETKFVKHCEDKSENVCVAVTETKCEVS
jgi:hypothetical protein